MLCCKCKKRPAVVFVSTNASSEPQGYCLSCARDLGIKPVTDMMEKMGISEEDIDNVQEQVDSLMSMSESGEMPSFAEMMGQTVDEISDDENEDGDFSPGGAPTFPFFQNYFNGKKEENNADVKKDKKSNKKRRNVEAYCENLTGKAKNRYSNRQRKRDSARYTNTLQEEQK